MQEPLKRRPGETHAQFHRRYRRHDRWDWLSGAFTGMAMVPVVFFLAVVVGVAFLYLIVPLVTMVPVKVRVLAVMVGVLVFGSLIGLLQQRLQRKSDDRIRYGTLYSYTAAEGDERTAHGDTKRRYEDEG